MYLPCIITSSALVILYKEALVNGGPISQICKLLNIPYTNPFVRTTDTSYMGSVWAIVFYNVSFGIGGNIIVLCGAMNSIDPQILESGELDGCSWFRELTSIIIPSIWPTLSTIIVLSFASILASTGPILAFDKGLHGTYTLNFYIFDLVGSINGLQAHGEYLASAIGLCMTVVSFPLALIVKRILYGKEK